MIHALIRMLGAGKLNTTTTAGSVLVGQVQLSAAETRDNTPIVQHFGLASTPPAGSDVLYAAFGGDRSRVVAFGTNHQSFYPPGIPSGGVKMYDEGGRFVGMLNDGNIIMMAPGETLHQLVTQVFQALFNEHTHPTPDGESGPPTQQMTSAHLTGATRAGGP